MLRRCGAPWQATSKGWVVSIVANDHRKRMNLLYCDESNLEHRPGDFLLYGGVHIPSVSAASLSDTIETLRRRAEINPSAALKFNPKPDHLSHENFKDFKQKILIAAHEHECKILAYGVLHDLAGDPDTARRFGINTVLYHYHCFLNMKRERGLAIIDRFNDEGNRIDAHLREKMATGVKIHHHRVNLRLSNIVGFHYSAIGQSHFTSLIDIVIGSLRYALNVHTRGIEDQRAGALDLLRVLSPMFVRREGSDVVPDLGFCFSPMNVRVPRYHAMYVGVQAFLREAGVNSIQPIRNDG